MGGTENEEFSKRLKLLREQEKLSRVVLSELCGLPSSAIGKYERGNAAPGLKALVAIANYFHVSTDYLMGRTNY